MCYDDRATSIITRSPLYGSSLQSLSAEVVRLARAEALKAGEIGDLVDGGDGEVRAVPMEEGGAPPASTRRTPSPYTSCPTRATSFPGTRLAPPSDQRQRRTESAPCPRPRRCRHHPRPRRCPRHRHRHRHRRRRRPGMEAPGTLSCRW
jgi:hypothetical protein